MKKKHINYFIFFAVLLWISYILYESYSYDQETKDHGIVSIGKITNFKKSSAYVRYHYYVNELSYGADSPRNNNKVELGQFYKVIYSSKNPENSRIYLDEPITDTVAILKAGFSALNLKK